MSTALAIAGSAVGGAKVIEKILGPTAEYLGEGLRDRVEKSNEKLAQVFARTKLVLGSRIDLPGGVPIKVLREVVNGAAWAENELLVEYFGGVLASSRTEVGRDDRGAYFASLVSRLTTYQLKTHHILYSGFKDRYNGKSSWNFNGPHGNNLRILTMSLKLDKYELLMEIDGPEAEQSESILQNTLLGLQSEGLIDKARYITNDIRKTRDIELLGDSHAQPGIHITCTGLGAELFLWAYGHGDRHPNDLCLDDLEISTSIEYDFDGVEFGVNHPPI